jgi:hypothetical protein
MNRRRFIRTSAASSLGFLLTGTSSVFARTPRKILVFGGTDFLGPAVVDALMADGHTVTIFNRGVTNAEFFPHVEKLRGFRSADPNDQDLSALSRRRFDVVIDVWPNDPDVVASAAEFLKDRTNHYSSSPRSAPTITNFSQSPIQLSRTHRSSPGTRPGVHTIEIRRKANAGFTKLLANG